MRWDSAGLCLSPRWIDSAGGFSHEWRSEEVRMISRFQVFALLWLVVGTAPAPAAETLRISAQSTGTFAWQLDVIRRHGLAQDAGLDLKISESASPDAGKLALNSGSVDLAVVDWLWVARARALGAKWLFYPYSSAAGAVMVKGDSPVREIKDLKDRVLGIAGGPLDKSWLIVQAAAIRQGIDLKRAAKLEYGAPPLISQKLQQGETEASLNFWNFCASLETRGYRRVLDVRDAEAALGLDQPVALIGYVFSEQFAANHRSTIDRPQGRRWNIVAENLFADRPDCDLGCCRRAASIAAASRSTDDRSRYRNRHPHRRAAVPDGLYAWSRRRFVRDRHGPRHDSGLRDGTVKSFRSVC